MEINERRSLELIKTASQKQSSGRYVSFRDQRSREQKNKRKEKKKQKVSSEEVRGKGAAVGMTAGLA